MDLWYVACCSYNPVFAKSVRHFNTIRIIWDACWECRLLGPIPDHRIEMSVGGPRCLHLSKLLSWCWYGFVQNHCTNPMELETAGDTCQVGCLVFEVSFSLATRLQVLLRGLSFHGNQYPIPCPTALLSSWGSLALPMSSNPHNKTWQ